MAPNIEEKMAAAILELAAATREQARQAKRLADLHDTLWLALPPRTRAKLLGISTSAERARRAKLEAELLLRGA
jgi:hypothetical protein